MAGIDYLSASTSVPYRNNGGGLNSSASPISLEDNESSDCLNVEYDKFGSIRKRGGYVCLNTTAYNSGATWNGLKWFEKSDGNDYLIGVCGNKLVSATSLTPAATPFTDRTGALTLTAGNNNHVSWAIHLDTVLGTNNVDLPFKCVGSSNGAALVVPTNLTKAKFVTVFKGFTILLHVTVDGTDHKSRLYWSTIDTIETWDDADYRDLGKNDGQEITGVAVLGESLVVFKDRYIWLGTFTGDSDIPFVFSQARSSVGCVSGASIQEVENGLVFLSTDGYYYFDGNNSYKISDRVSTTLEEYSLSRYPHVPSVYHFAKDTYIAAHSLDGSATNNRVITWNSANNAWAPWTGMNFNCLARAYSSGKEVILAGDYAGHVYILNTGSTDYPENSATAINAYHYTKWFDYGDLVSKKGVPDLAIYYQYASTTLTFAYSYDFETVDQYSTTFSMSAGGSLYGTALYDTDTYVGFGGAVKRRNLTGRGRVVRFGFKNGVAGEGFTIDGFGVVAHLETLQ
jgi:hypothetical protein